MLPSSKNPDKNLQEPQVISDNITKLIIYEPQGVINNIGEYAATVFFAEG